MDGVGGILFVILARLTVAGNRGRRWITNVGATGLVKFRQCTVRTEWMTFFWNIRCFCFYNPKSATVKWSISFFSVTYIEILSSAFSITRFVWIGVLLVLPYIFLLTLCTFFFVLIQTFFFILRSINVFLFVLRVFHIHVSVFIFLKTFSHSKLVVFISFVNAPCLHHFIATRASILNIFTFIDHAWLNLVPSWPVLHIT